MKTFKLIAGSLLVFAGCTLPKPATAPEAASITSFTTSAAEVAKAGEKVTLSWETAKATTLSLEQMGVGPVTISSSEPAGTASVTINADSIFALTAGGEGGSDARFVSVKVKTTAGENVLFTALPATIQGGESTTLVWNAPGAMVVSLNPKGGAALDLSGQKQSGTLRVSPAQSTTYELHSDAVVTEVTVAVQPRVIAFAHEGPAPESGKPVLVKWQTAGGTQAMLTRLGQAQPLVIENDAGQVAQGQFTDTAPNPLAPDAVLTYQLEVTGPGGSTSQLLRLDSGATPRITQFNLPAYAAVGGLFNVTWATAQADSLEISVDGKPAYVALTKTEVDQGNVTIPTPMTAKLVRLVAKSRRGGQVFREQLVTPIGPVTLNTFSADKMSIVNGGEPVVISWNVSNARHVMLEEVGAQPVFEDEGSGLESKSLTVYPNRPSVTYRLQASNAAGSKITEQSVTVTVSTPKGLTFDRQVPQGALAKVTGFDVVSGVSVSGLPVVQQDGAGAAFIDISGIGNEVVINSETASVLVALGRGFDTRVYGSAVTAPTLSVSPNGWLSFSAAAIGGPDDNSGALKVSLPALALAPFWDDLTPGPYGRLYVHVAGYGPLGRLIVQWNRFALDGQPQTELTFQAQVYGDGRVVFAYSKLDTGAPITATVGINNATLTQSLSPPSLAAAGHNFGFLGPATLPAPMLVGAVPYLVDVLVPQGVCRVPAQSLLPPGQFAITEVNPFPSVADGEWVEVSNFTSTPVDLKDWTLDFGGAAAPITFSTSVVVPANGQLLLGQSATGGDGLNVGHVYGTAVHLPDALGSVSLQYLGAPYSTLRWSAADVTLGASVQQDAPSSSLVYAVGLGALSCEGTASYGTQGQRGTPGAVNPPCFTYALSALPNGNFESIAATGTLVETQSTFVPGPDGDEGVAEITLPASAVLFGRPVSSLWVSTNGFLSATPLEDSHFINKVRPSNSVPVGTLAVFWDDLETNSATDSGIYVERKDPSPAVGDEYTIISWEHHAQYGTGQDLNFQAKFFASGEVEYHYGVMSMGPGAEGLQATAWLEEPTGRGAMPISINTATEPGLHSSTGWRFNPL